MDPSKLDKNDAPPTPASWETVSRWITKGLIDPMKHDVLTESMLLGKVGRKPTVSFMSFARDKYSRFVTAKEIFEGKGFTKAIQEKFFAQQGKGKNDKITASIHDILAYVKEVVAEANELPDALAKSLIKLVKDKRFKTVNRTLLMSPLLKGEGAQHVSKALAVDEDLVVMIEKEMDANSAKAQK